MNKKISQLPLLIDLNGNEDVLLVANGQNFRTKASNLIANPGELPVGSITKATVGLGNVDNTSDLTKPISAATQQALDAKAASLHNHALGDLIGLQAALDAKVDDTDMATKADVVHLHAITDVTGLQAALDAKVDDVDISNKSDIGHAHAIADVTNLQSELDGKASVGDLASKSNTVHNHLISDVTNLQLALDDKSTVGHTHGISSVTGLEQALDSKATVIQLLSKADAVHLHEITDINGLQLVLDSKLETLDIANKADAVHAHAIGDVTGLQAVLDTKLDSLDIDGKSDIGHGHAILDVTGLQAALDSKVDDVDLSGKADSVHAHAIGDVTDLQLTLNTKSAIGHGHVIGDTTGLQTALDGKADDAHTHAIADTTGLQTALDGKATVSHAHAISDTTGLQTALDGKADDIHAHAISDVTNLQTTLTDHQNLLDTFPVTRLLTSLATFFTTYNDPGPAPAGIYYIKDTVSYNANLSVISNGVTVYGSGTFISLEGFFLAFGEGYIPYGKYSISTATYNITIDYSVTGIEGYGRFSSLTDLNNKKSTLVLPNGIYRVGNDIYTVTNVVLKLERGIVYSSLESFLTDYADPNLTPAGLYYIRHSQYNITVFATDSQIHVTGVFDTLPILYSKLDNGYLLPGQYSVYTTDYIVTVVFDGTVAEGFGSFVNISELNTHANISALSLPKGTYRVDTDLYVFDGVNAPVLGTSHQYDIARQYADIPPSNFAVFSMVFTRTIQFPINFSNSQAVAKITATAEATFNVVHTPSGGSPTTVGTLVWGIGAAAGVFTLASPLTCSAGGRLEIISPAIADVTLADLAITLAGVH